MTPDHSTVRFLPCGDTAFTMELGDKVDRAVSAKVVALHARIGGLGIEGVIETVPTFRSLLVLFDPDRATPQALQRRLLEILGDCGEDRVASRLWRLPVCYGGEHGPDLASVAAETGLGEDEVRRLHSGENYFVYMIGFLPGYGYMGDVPELIRIPRRTNPRTRVPPGSVAIAQDMTAIYSLQSPGGWHLIGRTPAPLYNPAAERPVVLSPGDLVAFEPVSVSEYALLERDFASGARILQAEDAA